MTTITYRWSDESAAHSFDFAHVSGTQGQPYGFGEPPDARLIAVDDFYIGTVPVTQALWEHVMGAEANRSFNRGARLPVENVSWDEITQPGGFLERLNASAMATAIQTSAASPLRFRLPTESEWEYAARGGPHWRDDFLHSGSANISDVAWYDRRHGDWTQWVGLKAPNQLGLYDMSGNVWEWCHDTYSPDVRTIPADGSASVGDADERVLRGGCYNNWAMHCTVSKRYEIGRAYRDGCIGFRLVLAVPMSER